MVGGSRRKKTSSVPEKGIKFGLKRQILTIKFGSTILESTHFFGPCRHEGFNEVENTIVRIKRAKEDLK